MGRDCGPGAGGLRPVPPFEKRLGSSRRRPCGLLMTSQGSAPGRFQRAIRDRHLRRASMAARELGTVSLADALALTLLTREVGDDRWPRAAARWLGRFIVESPAMTIGEAGLAAAAMQELVGRESRLAAETLRQLAATHGHATVVALLESR